VQFFEMKATLAGSFADIIAPDSWR